MQVQQTTTARGRVFSGCIGLMALLLLIGNDGFTSRADAQVAATDVDNAETLVDKITTAHKQASDNALAFAEYVQGNETNLDHNVMRTHCDAMGRGLDDALYFTPELANLVRDEDAKRRTRRVLQLDATAKRAFKTLLDKLRGSSITALELRALAMEIDQNVRAAQRELARIMMPKTSAVVAAR